ncbi:unnamed protein product [marine sediment metagenome]|uniref:Uncharacterized protein n=1 Tax=marine sediment metagenome TaxID=412755 RepID=X1Q7Y6_9ZZZZ
MRPQESDDLDKIADGVLRSMQLSGYDYPIRKLCRSGTIRCVTLPMQVRNYLELENGDWVVFGSTRWSGVVTFTKLTADRYDCIAGLGGRDSLKLARKVQGRKCGVRIVVPPAICRMLSADVGDSLMFGLAPRANMITIAVIKGGGDSVSCQWTG